MKKLFTTIIFVLMALTSQAQRYHLDVNDDGKIELNDALIIIDYILGRFNPTQSYLACPDENHPHMIDLGLPSGTKWACCNVDTEHPSKQSPTNYGGYYAWGETEEKDHYHWDNYIHCDGDRYSCHDIGKDIAGTEYDVAHVKWGNPWVMPSYEQNDELQKNCYYELITENGVKGGKFTSKINGASIFLPAAGCIWSKVLDNAGSYGWYWSSTQRPKQPEESYYFNFYSTYVYWYSSYFRFRGHTVRPVAKIASSQKYHLDVNGNGSIDLTDALIIVDYILGKFNPDDEPKAYLTCPDDHHPHMIDLGLPSGTKWACCNVGAEKPEGYGGYYAWGETKEKEVYNEVTYLYCTGEDTNGDGWYNKNRQFQSIGNDICGTNYDVAHVKWGGNWQMPSWEQFQEINNVCTYVWMTSNGISGRLYSSPNGGKIFLPAAGYRSFGSLETAESVGTYWSGTLFQSVTSTSYYLIFDINNLNWYNYSSRELGHTVRPVWSK